MAGMIVRVALLLGGLFNVAVGLWSFLFPSNFANSLATFLPYNLHLFHDIGAFQIGLGLTMLLAIALRDALLALLAGNAAAAALHTVSHVIDRNIGGHPATDIPLLSLLALLLVSGAVARAVQLRS
jgi:hypothetical protein